MLIESGDLMNPIQIRLQSFNTAEEESHGQRAWQAMVHGVAESWTQLKRLSTHAHTHTHIVIIPVCVFLHITIAQL